MPLNVKTRPLVSTKPDAQSVTSAADLRSLASKFPALAKTARDLESLQSALNAVNAVLRSAKPAVDQIVVTDSQGHVIGAIGDFLYQGVRWLNYFSELHVGDPLGTRDPSKALFNADPTTGEVTVGQNGSLGVLDPYEQQAAWIGTQFDVLAVTGAADNGAGLIRLTVTGHPLQTGDVVRVLGVGGVINAKGIFAVTRIDGDQFDLQSSVWAGSYTVGGTVDRLLHVSGAANNGSGLIRLTITAHGYVTGDRVNVQAVGGVPNATGQWTIQVPDANHIDLVGSTFAGTYTSGGTCLRYFAGMLAQTFAIGPDFRNYKLRAFADGSLRIYNAIISLVAGANSIVLDPTTPTITVTSAAGTVTIDASVPSIAFSSAAGTVTIDASTGVLQVKDSGGGELAFLGGNTTPRMKGMHSSADVKVDGDVEADNLNALVSIKIGGVPLVTDVYSKAEVDALLAGKSDVGHTHAFTGDPMPNHDHGGTVTPGSAGTPSGSIS